MARTPLLVWFVALGMACVAERSTARTGAESNGAPMPGAAAASKPAAGPASAAVPPAESIDAAVPPEIAPDGNDDPVAPEEGPVPLRGHFVRIGRPPLSLRRLCHLKPFGDSLYAAHANEPLNTDGATITRYNPDGARPFSIAFDWNRPGEPTRGGGAGQGFLRIHALGGRLFVPDADPPHNGFGISEHGTEGFVFVSDHQGTFASSRAPHHRPPGPPDADDKPGAAVLPRAYHVIDVIRYRGRLYASTGSVPPNERAWNGPSPGALHVAAADLSRWSYEVDYPYPWKNGVWRLTFLVRFRDRLYAGIQDYDGREPNDYVVFHPPKGSDHIDRAFVRAVRISSAGAAQTVRWYADRGSLYWIAWTKTGIHLLRTTDGEVWQTIRLPSELGHPTDIIRYRGFLHVLTEWSLIQLIPATSDAGTFEVRTIGTVDEKKTPFPADDVFCSAPLTAYRGELYAGGQRDGALYKFVVDESAPSPGGEPAPPTHR